MMEIYRKYEAGTVFLVHYDSLFEILKILLIKSFCATGSLFIPPENIRKTLFF